MNVVNEYGEKWNGFTEVVTFCRVACRYFNIFLLQGVDRNWRQACLFYLAPGLICEGYWKVNSRKSIFRIADPTIEKGNHAIVTGKDCKTNYQAVLAMSIDYCLYKTK